MRKILVLVLSVSIFLGSFCFGVSNNSVEAYGAAAKMVTKNIIAVFNDGDIDAAQYLSEGFISNDVKWSVSEENIATISETGLVTPVDFGSVNVYANIKGKKVLKLTINIVSSNENKIPFSMVGKDLFKNKDFLNWFLENMIANYSLPQLLREEIDSIEEMAQYITLSNFYYNDFPILVEHGWSNTGIFGAEGSLKISKGVCEDIANVAVYLLKNDYDDIGAINVLGKYGHMYNYVMQDGKYYVFDFTSLISSNGSDALAYWYDNALIWSGDDLTDYTKSAIKYATDTSSDMPYTEYVELIVGYSCNHFDYVPSQYRSDNWGSINRNIKGYCYESQTQKQFGLEEGIKVFPIYINTTGDCGCTWEIISVPSKDIPFYAHTYFSTETMEEKYERQIIKKEGFLDPTGKYTHKHLVEKGIH